MRDTSIPAELRASVCIAALAVDTSYEPYEAYETMGNLRELYANLGVEEEVFRGEVIRVSHPSSKFH